jgi:regulator of protease activity HflC (stomatin/prohibitin superfamily)
MTVVLSVLVLVVVALIAIAMSARIIKQYERVVLFELGKVKDQARGPRLSFIVPFVDRVHRVSAAGQSRFHAAGRRSRWRPQPSTPVMVVEMKRVS